MSMKRERNANGNREPAEYTVGSDRIEITTMPHTDLWQRTYYHFRNDNAPVLQMETEEKYFSFIVRTDFAESHHRFDQCGIVMYLDSENWLKGSVGLCRIRERIFSASRFCSHEPRIFRLGDDSHPRRCKGNVVSVQPERG